MEKFNGYEKAKVYADKEVLPVGGYLLKILDVKEINYDWGNVLNISFDIAEGEQKDFYKSDYAAQSQEDKKWKGTYRLNVPKDDGSEKDEWTMRNFKTAIVAIEESNSGYHWNWDEQTLKGKSVGALFHNKEWEYDGKTGFFTSCHSFRAVQIIREGKFTIPKDKLLKKTSAPSGFAPMTEEEINDLPF